jgi:hypothetical protein
MTMGQAINFRGAAHERSIAVRDVALSKGDEARAAEIAAIKQLAAFYANSAGPLEQLLDNSSDAGELGRQRPCVYSGWSADQLGVIALEFAP